MFETAWADGTLDAKERRAVVDRTGVARDSAAGALLEAWLDRRPDPKLLAAWTHLVQEMCEQLDADGVARLNWLCSVQHVKVTLAIETSSLQAMHAPNLRSTMTP